MNLFYMIVKSGESEIFKILLGGIIVSIIWFCGYVCLIWAIEEIENRKVYWRKIK